MTLPTPTPPEWLFRVALSFNTEDADEDATPAQREIAGMLAEAVWDALCSEGFIRYAIGTPEELGRWIVPTFDASNRHGDDWTRVLVVPLARHNEPCYTDRTQ